MVIDVILGMLSLMIAGDAKISYKIMRLDEKKMATHYYVSYNIVLNKFV